MGWMRRPSSLNILHHQKYNHWAGDGMRFLLFGFFFCSFWDALESEHYCMRMHRGQMSMRGAGDIIFQHNDLVFSLF